MRSGIPCEILPQESPLQHQANVFRQGDFGVSACCRRDGYGSCGLRHGCGFIAGGDVSVLVVAWDRQGGTKLTVALIEGVSCDLATRINVVTKPQMQRRRTNHERIYVCHNAVLPEKSTAKVKALCARPAYHLALLVNAESAAVEVSRQCAEILHTT